MISSFIKRIICSTVTVSMVLTSVPSVMVLADENDETEATYTIQAVDTSASDASAEELAAETTVPESSGEEDVDDNVTSIPTDDSEPVETTAETDSPVPITTEPTEALEPDYSDYAEPTESADETDATEATENTTETTEATDATSETTEETTEATTSETTEEPVVDEPATIVTAQSAEEYAELVAGLSDLERVIVNTSDDLTGLGFVSGVYFDGVYTLGFADDAELNNAIGYFIAMNYDYALDGELSLCGLGDGSVIQYADINPSATVKVAVIDTGSNLANEYYSVVGDDTADYNGHGTAMCNYILNETDDAYIISIKAIDGDKGQVADVMSAIQLAESLDVDYILMAMSIRDNGQYDAFESLIASTKATVVASAGNNGRDAVKYLPAGIDGVITAGAVGTNAELKSFSNYGASVEYYVDAESTSEASAKVLGMLIAGKEINAYAVNNNEGWYYSEGSCEYFTLNYDEGSLTSNPTVQFLTAADLNGKSYAEYRADVISYCKSHLGSGNDTDCIDFALDAVCSGLGHGRSGSSGMGFDLGSYGCTSFMQSGGCNNSNNYGLTGLYMANKDSNGDYISWSQRHIDSAYDLAAYLSEYAEPGDLVLMGKGTTWKHAFIYYDCNGDRYDNQYDSHGNNVAMYGGVYYDNLVRVYQDTETTSDGPQLKVIGPAYFKQNSNGSKGWTNIVVLKAPNAPDDVPLGLTKLSTDGYSSFNGGCYSFAGTQYKLYADQACTQVLWTYDFGADGHTIGDIFKLSGTEVLNEPTYFLKETAAGPGYLIDNSIYAVSFHADRTISVSTVSGSGSAVVGGQSANANSAAEIKLYDAPTADAFTFVLRKETPDGERIPDARLNGTVYYIEYYNEDFAVTTSVAGKTPQVIFAWTVTDAKKAQNINLETLMTGLTTGNVQVISSVGSENYLKGIWDQTGDEALPLGTYRIYEASAAKGFDVNGQVIRCRIYQNGSGNDAAHQLWNEATASSTANSYVWSSAYIDQTNGDVYLTQQDKATHALYSLTKTLTASKSVTDLSQYNFQYVLYDQTNARVVATGTLVNATGSQCIVTWTYQQHWENYDRSVADLYGTQTTKLDLPVYASNGTTKITYRVYEYVPQNFFGDYSAMGYTWATPTGWTSGTYNNQPVYTKNVTFSDDQDFGDTIVNVPQDTQFTLTKMIPASDLFDPSKVSFNLYWANGNLLVATGTVDSNGTITWTKVPTSGFGVQMQGSGSYNIRTQSGTVTGLPYGNYYITETWDKEYLNSLDGTEAIEIIETNNSGWTLTSDTAIEKTYRFDFSANGPEVVITNGTVTNDRHTQWFELAKQTTVAGDATTIQFGLYAKDPTTNSWQTAPYAVGTCTTSATPGTFNVTWDTNCATRTINGVTQIALPEGDWEIREINPVTYYQNGYDNVAYSYMVPVNTDGTSWSVVYKSNGIDVDYFYYDFHAGNTNTSVISKTVKNTRIEGSLTINKMEEVNNGQARSFEFEIYYRGNGASPDSSVGDFTRASYYVDTLVVTCYQGSGSATINKLPEGWYEIVEVNNDGWAAQWQGTANNTADGKLVHIDSNNKTVAAPVANENEILVFGVTLNGVLVYNRVSTKVLVRKLSDWTGYMVNYLNLTSATKFTFELYKDSNGNGILDDNEADYCIKAIDADQDSEVLFENIDVGHYIIREVATINGYYLSAADWAFEVAGPDKVEGSMSNKPYTAPVTVTKLDNETDELLEGAEFTVFEDTNDNGVYDAGVDTVANMWVDANNDSKMETSEIVPSSFTMTSKGVYESDGEFHFNDGITVANRYFIVETKAPDNYFFVNADGTFSDTPVYQTFTIDAADTTDPAFTVAPKEFTFKNQTGTVYVYKKDEKTGEFLTGATFVVYNDQACTQAVGTLTCDETNKVYYYKGLGLGTYYLKETIAPEWYESDPNAYEFQVTLTDVHPVVSNKTWTVIAGVDGEFLNHSPIEKTLFADADTKVNVAKNTTTVNLVDHVYYSGLHVGEEYQLTATLYDVDTGEIVKDAQGKEIIVTHVFTATQETGIEDVTFNFETTVTTKTWVASEQLKNLTTGRNVGFHMDLTDKLQTVKFPSIHTTLISTDTQAHVAPQADQLTVVDTVTYENLLTVNPETNEPMTYTMSGVLMDKVTGTVLKDAQGNPITASKTFSPAAENGTVEIEFTFDASLMTDGMTFVAFESLIYTNVNDEDITVATHNDINDVDQTIDIPDIHTTFYDLAIGIDEDIATNAKDVTLVDRVYYENITTGLEYTVYGTVMIKETGKALLDKDGNPVIAEAKFTPTTSTGYVEVTFEHVDTTLAGGQSLVAFETLDYNGVTLVIHADLTDVDQTVHVPDLHTTLTDTVTGLHMGTEQSIELVDVVEYENLVPGKTYSVTGTLQDKETGETILDKDGNPITATTELVLDATATGFGFVEVKFTIDGSLLAGKTVVAFETLTYNKKDIVVHADINDEDQSVDFPDMHTTANINGAKTFDLDSATTITVTDVVTYENLDVNSEYVIKGTLMNKRTNAAVTDINGNIVTAEVRFSPETKNGSVTVTFTFEHAGLVDGDELVVFEKAYLITSEVDATTGEVTEKEILLVTHEDWNDADQTTKVYRTPKTGYDVSTMPYIMGLTASIASLAGVVIFLKKKNTEASDEA